MKIQNTIKWIFENDNGWEVTEDEAYGWYLDIIMGYINGIIDMNTTDYVEFWGAIDTGASARRWDDGYQTTHFMGYKLLD